MEVSCSSGFLVSAVGWIKGSDYEEFLGDSVNSRADLSAVSTADRIGNFALDGGISTMS